ncbi:Phosphoglycolate phosphatase [termite gut metagenome]|uniref:Phosphoglycolate phosphatase n=1 Tax=termite gut metagenome TaxID=433724 RepID=A0A5J4QRT6_9ZZZZ
MYIRRDFLNIRYGQYQMKQLIIFDLDGTLLNTIADLAQSTNYALRKLGFPAHTEEAYNFMVGNGINKLFERALPEDKRTEANVLRMRTAFFPYYDEHNADKTRSYPGITELLRALQEQDKKIGVASNKYHAATLKLISHYFPEVNFAAVLGQREGIAPKPNPAIVYDIMKLAGASKDTVLYVGDSKVDMLTARNSGVTSCGVTWGFRPRSELEEYQPDFIVDTAQEVLGIVTSN